jgi:hypothetical protein
MGGIAGVQALAGGVESIENPDKTAFSPVFSHGINPAREVSERAGSKSLRVENPGPPKKKH